MEAVPPKPHPKVSRFLLVGSRWLVFSTIILTVVLLSAGTFLSYQTRKPGTFGIGLRDLSMVSYDGIIPYQRRNWEKPHEVPDFAMRLHLFPNSFAWECDNCDTNKYAERGGIILAGIVSRGPRWRLDPLALMNASVGDLDDRSPAMWHCDPHQLDKCEFPFLEAWLRGENFRIVPAILGFSFYVSAIGLTAVILLNEFLITYQPHLMRCRCRFQAFKRWCPYAKGTIEEVEALDDHFWDGVRLSFYGVVFVLFTLAALHDTVLSMLVHSHVRRVEQFLPHGQSLNAHRGVAFHTMVWSLVVLSALALLFVEIRWHLGRTSDGWIEIQDLDSVEEGDALQSESTLALVEPGDPPPPYTDVEIQEGSREPPSQDAAVPK